MSLNLLYPITPRRPTPKSISPDGSGTAEIFTLLFSHHVEGALLEEARSSTNKGMAIGHDRFKDEIEGLTGRRLKPKKVGRPTGWRKKTDDI